MGVMPARAVARPVAGSPGFAALLSALLPGLGQVYQDRVVRGLLMFLLPPLTLFLVGAFVFIAEPLARGVIMRASLVAILVVGLVFAYHVAIVVDAFAGRRGASWLWGRRPIDYALLVASVLALVALYYPVYRQSSAWAGLVATVFQTPERTISVGISTAGTSAPEWSGRDRLNVLLLGIDTRANEQTQNTDSVIVLSFDPASKTAAMLSIPRDTLVDIPGVGRDKVNAAYARGGGPRGGAELARRTVERFLGIPIHSYALIDFPAFRGTVQAVGGAIVDVRRPLRDEDHPTADHGVERVRFLAGPQLMDGDEALKYARSRHDSNDFSRARRQQLVLFALRERFAQAGFFRLPGIVSQVGPLVRTSFDPGNVVPLARTVLAIDPSTIKSEVLLPCNIDVPHCELTENNSESGYYLIPDERKVRLLVADLFGASSRAP